MKIIFILLTCHLNLIQISDSKKYLAILNDELLPYDIDKSVTEDHKTYFNLDNLVLEQIDDDMIQIGGYLKAIKSTDTTLPIHVYVRSKYLDKSSWVEGPIRLTLPSWCPELVNPTRFWYNISKQATKCPPQEGDIWNIETQIIDMKIDLPASIPITQWKFHVLVTQGLPGYEKVKAGLTYLMEFVLVN